MTYGDSKFRPVPSLNTWGNAMQETKGPFSCLASKLQAGATVAPKQPLVALLLSSLWVGTSIE